MPDPLPSDDKILPNTAVETAPLVLTDDAVNGVDPYAGFGVLVDIFSYVLVDARNRPRPPRAWKASQTTWSKGLEDLVMKYEQLEFDSWGVLVTPSHDMFAFEPRANCAGWTHGTFAEEDMANTMDGMLAPFLASREYANVTDVYATYKDGLATGKLGRYDLMDYYMKTTYEATRTEDEASARYVIYGSTWGTEPTINASHIALKLDTLNQWLSKPSLVVNAIVHRTAAQLEGDAMGSILGFYKSNAQFQRIALIFLK